MSTATAAATPSSERTPLLQRRPSNPDHVEIRLPNQAEREASRRKHLSWTIVALVVLCATTATVLFLGFVVPTAGEEYAKQAVKVDVSRVSAVPSQKGVGVSARVTVQVDAERVDSTFNRKVGRMATWVARYVEVKPSLIKVRAPQFGEDTIARVRLPAFVVDVRNGHFTELDIVGEVEPDSLDTIQVIANRYLAGNLGDFTLEGETEIDARSGLIGLGRQTVRQSIVLKSLPSVPSVNITSLNLTEVDLAGHKAVGVDVSASTVNPYPISLDTPPLVFGIYLPSCSGSVSVLDKNSHTQKITQIAKATLGGVEIRPGSDINAHVEGVIDAIPEDLMTPCPGTESSPLDNFLAGYMNGDETLLYIRGAPPSESPNVPTWISEFLSTITLPLPFPGHTLDSLIKKFGFTNVDFDLPDPTAPPGSPSASPQLSGTVTALIALPKEMNFPISVQKARANADIFYQRQKFGEIHIRDWVPARSSKLDDGDLNVEADIDKTPVVITNGRVFRDIATKILFGGEAKLEVVGAVDVMMETSMGVIVVRDIPANGTFTVDSF